MNVHEIKENIPAVGEEVVLNGKVMTSAPVVTMTTPRQPLMDLSQIPRPTTEDQKLSKPTARLKPVTPLYTPQPKNRTRKCEPSTLIYEDKNESTCHSSSNQVEKLHPAARDARATYLDKLSEKLEERELDNSISQAIDKCVADILSERNLVDKTGNENAVETDTTGEIDLLSYINKTDIITVIAGKEDKNKFEDSVSNVSNVHEIGNNLIDHTYSVDNLDKLPQARGDVLNQKGDTLEIVPDHNYCMNSLSIDSEIADVQDGQRNSSFGKSHICCLTKEESCSSSNSMKEEDFEGSYYKDKLQDQIDRDSEILLEEGTCFIESSNMSGNEYLLDHKFVEIDIQQNLETETMSEIKEDSEHLTSVRDESEIATTKDRDAEALSGDHMEGDCNNATSQYEKSGEEISPACTPVTSPVLNPQGVTYMMSLNTDSNTIYSPWKQSPASPDCIKPDSVSYNINDHEVLPTYSADLTLDKSRTITDIANTQDISVIIGETELHDRSELTDTMDLINNAACSPMPILACDAGVQNNTDLHSAMTSPFVPYNTQNTSVNTDNPNLRSAATSPFVLYDTQNTSVNTENVDTVDAEVGTDTPATIYVNIIRDQPEVKSISVSTDESFSDDIDSRCETVITNDTCTNTSVIDTNNLSMNTEAADTSDANTSIDTSPIHDEGTMTDTATATDVSVSTSLDMAEVGVQAQPEVETVYTEMTDLPMATTGTSMTPVKFFNKFGKRLTAEDVRRQHPRALANEIETLKLQNERLESHVKSVEHERDKLRSSLKETKGNMGKLEKQITDRENEKDEEKNKIWELANRCEELEATLREQTQSHKTEVAELENKMKQTEVEVNSLRTQHSEEIRQLKDEYEQTNYRDHFLASQKLVQQLQSELSEYTQLLEDLEQSQQIQAKLEEKMSVRFTKVKLAEEAVLSLHRTLEAKELDLSGQRSSLELRLVALREDETKIVAEREQMQEIVSCCKVKMEELDTQYQRSCEDLSAANSKLEDLQAALTSSDAELSCCKEEKENLEEKVGTLTQREISLQRELELLQVTLKQKLEQEEIANTRLTELDSLYQTEREAKKKVCEQSSLEILNLQHTLDSREQDIDMLEKDLFECREIIYSQMEKIRVTEEKEKSAAVELKALETENLELKGCCAVLRGKEQELTEVLKYTREELSGTREHASRLLKEQGTEMADCSTAIGELTDHMTSVLNSLNIKVGIQKTPVKAVEEPVKLPDPSIALDLSKPSHNAPEQSQGSLVSMILNAAESRDIKQENDCDPTDVSEDKFVNDPKNDHPVSSASHDSDKVDSNIQVVKPNLENVDSPTTQSRKKLGFSGNSAFAPVRQGLVSESVKPTSGQNLSALSVSGQAHEQTLSKLPPPSTKESERLSEQVQKVVETFVEINRLVSLLEKASRSALQDIRRENEDLNLRVMQGEFSERRLNSDVERNKKELEQSKELNNDLEQKLEEMGDRLGHYIEQEAEVKRLQQEMGHLHGKIQSLEAEKEFLNDQMKELLERLEQSTETAQASGVDIGTQKEILTLQKKVHRLKEQLQERQDLIEEVSNKAARRIQKLEDNWKKADAEVIRFDELIDIIRKTLVKNEGLLKDNEDIRKIIKLIDGRVSLSCFKKPDKLKPIKTSHV